jgi:hypothetical protein
VSRDVSAVAWEASTWSARSRARDERARTNQVDTDERRPRIGGEEDGVLPGGAEGLFPRCAVGRNGLACTHSAPRGCGVRMTACPGTGLLSQVIEPSVAMERGLACSCGNASSPGGW